MGGGGGAVSSLGEEVGKDSTADGCQGDEQEWWEAKVLRRRPANSRKFELWLFYRFYFYFTDFIFILQILFCSFYFTDFILLYRFHYLFYRLYFTHFYFILQISLFLLQILFFILQILFYRFKKKCTDFILQILILFYRFYFDFTDFILQFLFYRFYFMFYFTDSIFYFTDFILQIYF